MTRVLAAAVVSAGGGARPPGGERLLALAERLRSGGDFTATLAGARIEASGVDVVIGRETGEMKRRPVPDVALAPGEAAVWDGRFEITAVRPGWRVTAAAGRLNQLPDADRAILKRLPAWARGGLPVLIRDDPAAPVLAWRTAGVRTLAPQRFSLALGETTQESDLDRTIHGETPPSDLFS